MKHHLFAATVALLLPLTLIPSIASAQSASAGVQYDNNCKPLTDEDKALLNENIILNAIAPVFNSPCRGVEFVRNLVRKKGFDPDKIDADDVFNAARPNVSARSNPYGIPEGLSDEEFKRRLEQARYRARNPNWKADQEDTRRRQTNAANDDTRSFEQMLADDRQLRGDPVVLPPATPGGSRVVFQAANAGGPVPTSVGDIQGDGVLLGANGMKKGEFKAGKLNGYGEEIDPNGTWRGGTYDRGNNIGNVFEVRTINGKTYLAYGSVVNGKLDGMIERIFADGSRQYEEWEGGQLMQVGIRAPKGRDALPPQARYRPPVEVATEDAYKHTGPKLKIAPGTTFNPAMTTQGPGRSQKTASQSFEQSFADYQKSCEGIRLAKLKNGRTDLATLDNDAGIDKNWNVELFKSNDVARWVHEVTNGSHGKGPFSYDDLAYFNYGLAICAVNTRLRQLGLPRLPFDG